MQHSNQDGTIFSLNSKSLKLVDQFIDTGGNISSTESNSNIHISKAETAINKLSTNMEI